MKKKDIVLVFHCIGEKSNEGYYGCVSKKKMEHILRYIQRHFQISQLTEIGRNDEESRAAITFDDGLKSAYTRAFPVLKRLGIPATFFINPAFIGDKQREDIKEIHGISTDKRIMINKKELEEMSRHPLMRIGNHTMSHVNLSKKIGKNKIERQIIDAKEMLDRVITDEVKSFSYPWGVRNSVAKNIAENVHEVTLTTRHHMVRGGKSYDLPRIQAHRNFTKIKFDTNKYWDTAKCFYKKYRKKIGSLRRKYFSINIKKG